jgi:nicotine blue oxidoreductase
MGGPKALVRLDADGPTLVERAVTVLHDGGCSGVTVVAGAAGEEVAAVVNRLGWDVDIVPCPDWDEGMGASLRAGLTALARSVHEGEGSVDAALVTLVDLPDLIPDVVVRVLPSDGGPGLRATLRRAAYGGSPGHPALIGRDHWDGVVETAVGDQGARPYFRTHPHDLVECGDLATGRDVDTRADLGTASARVDSR